MNIALAAGYSCYYYTTPGKSLPVIWNMNYPHVMRVRVAGG